MPVSKATKGRLTRIIGKKLPRRLTERQALYLIRNPDELAGVLDSLADIVVTDEDLKGKEAQ